MRRRIRVASVVVAGALALSSCTAIDVRSLPQPGSTFGDGYDIVVEFENVLNLPDRAKVVLDGLTVGVVTKMQLANGHVDVTTRIAPDTVVPSNVQAVLQQATVLGDIYVAFERPPPSGPQPFNLGPGDKLPLAQTVSPPQLEDTIASLSNFIASGSIQRVQNTIIRLNRVTPSAGEVQRLTARVVSDLSDLSANIDDVDTLLDGASRTGEVLENFIPQLKLWFSPYGQLGFRRFINQANTVGTLLPGVGSIASSGYWLVPFLNSLADTVGAIQNSKINFEEEVPKFRRLFTDFFLPQDKHPAINITSIVGPDGREMSGNVQDVLRILGAMP